MEFEVTKMTKIKRYSLSALICGSVILALTAFAPSIIPMLWHITHSSSQLIDGYAVRVPRSSIAMHEGKGIKILRAKLGVPSTLYNFESIEIQPHQGRVDLGKWRDASMRAAVNHGFLGIKTYDLEFAGEPAACIERTGEDSYVPRIVFCTNAENMLIQYFGDEQGIVSMRDILRNTRRRN